MRESYKTELKGKELAPNSSIPRIVKRYEAAFADIGIEFIKTRPARLFLSKMAQEPDKVMPAAAIERFERLFGQIAQAHTKITGKSDNSFR